MRKKIIWLVVSSLMVLTLLAAGCAPAAKEAAPAPKEAAPAVKEAAPVVKEAPPVEGENMVKLTLTKRDGTIVEKLLEKPKYGGAVRAIQAGTQLFFDEALGHTGSMYTLHLTNDPLQQGALLKGPAGTFEASWVYNLDPLLDTVDGAVAESWEILDDTTMVFRIRKGIYWHNKAPVYGRELDAYDVAFTYNRLWYDPVAAKSYHNRGYPAATHLERPIEATDKWTVVFKTKPGMIGRVWHFGVWFTHIIPREVGEKKIDFNDWKNSVGTGPFILIDYVHQSSATFVRNPRYWQKDPRFPENQLPYVDDVRFLVIGDRSTQMSAMRTGKADCFMSSLRQEEAQQLMKTNPEIQWHKYLPGGGLGISLRMDIPGLPWGPQDDPNAIKVRRALSMSINRQEIADTYYCGQAELFAYPTMPIPDFEYAWQPLETFSPLIQELWGYHPDKAKQMLAEAGYPAGFKVNIKYSSAGADTADLLAIVNSYWAKIGVDLILDPKESAVMNSILVNFTYPEAVTGGSPGAPWLTYYTIQKDQGYNYARINDPVIEEAFFKTNTGLTYFDGPVNQRIYKGIAARLLERVYHQVLPAPYAFVPWQPWVKGYSGENQIGSSGNSYDYFKYLWIDQELQKKR